MVNKVSSFFNIENKKHSKLILILLSLIFFTGIFSVFTRYPMSWYDEQVHYARVLTYSIIYQHLPKAIFQRVNRSFFLNQWGKLLNH